MTILHDLVFESVFYVKKYEALVDDALEKLKTAKSGEEVEMIMSHLYSIHQDVETVG